MIDFISHDSFPSPQIKWCFRFKYPLLLLLQNHYDGTQMTIVSNSNADEDLNFTAIFMPLGCLALTG
jgi:hypothetical protein